MTRRELAGLIAASALMTLDGTAITVALPAIGRDLSMPVSRLQWISNAPLLVLAAMLLPAGAMADRLGPLRATRLGLVLALAGAIACMLAPAAAWLIAARAVQGAGGALILPAVLAALRAAFADPVERTRTFGIWAAWTGVASASGPLLGGGLVDVISWRPVFAIGATAACAALVLLARSRRRTHGPAGRPGIVPIVPTIALAALLGAVAYALIEGASASWRDPAITVCAIVAAAALLVLVRSRRVGVLLPPELVRAHNCVPANASTFAMYFGMFGLSFLLVLYTQQVLGYSAILAGVVLLPVSVMLFAAERFGRLTTRFGSRALVIAGAAIAAAGLAWLGTGGHPLPFWSRIVVGTALFGLGVSVAVSPVTQAAVSAVPEGCAGAASGLNHATVRTAGLIAIALLGSIAAPGGSQDVSTDGFGRAMLICAAVVGVIGCAAGFFLRDEKAGGIRAAA